MKISLYIRIVILMSLVSLIKANPNFDRYAEIFGKEISIFSKIYRESGMAGYIDCEGKLWILGDKWATDTLRRGVKTDTGWVYWWEKEEARYPHLLFSIYDIDGVKINEGNLGDSLNNPLLTPYPDGGAMIIAGGCTDHPWSHRCYNVFIQVDNEGKIICTNRTPKQSIYGLPVDRVAINDESVLFLTFVNQREGARIHNENDSIIMDAYEFPIWGHYLLEMLKNDNPFHWSEVVTFCKGSANEWRYSKDEIQIGYYDLEKQERIVQRYFVKKASFRKFIGFDAYPLKHEHRIIDVPEVQSVKLVDGGLVLTYFMKENDDIVAYQMRFDSLGQSIPSCSLKVMIPKGINAIPGNSKLSIKRVPGIRSIPKGWDGQKSVDVFIWGYCREDGMLYWSKYSYEQEPEE